MVVICRVGNKEFKEGTHYRVRYPAMTSGYIQYTFCSKEAGLEYIKNLNMNQRNRAKLIRA